MHPIILLIAKDFILLSGLILVYLFFTLHHRVARVELIKLFLLAAALSLLIAKLASHFISDPRPFVQGHFTPLLNHSADNGFPSDHTLLAALIGFVVFCFSRRLGAAALAIALLIGLSRMAAGVHHSWDILGSFIITLLSTYLALWVLGLFNPPAAPRQRPLRRSNDNKA